ncbi:SgcJ/EcaC family oxidoreductase [Myxococcus stipitatus]|uniref:YybH family protein n=1 Tax=Myxococcus stipitatus TaxID=83455 RepID=UPI001F38CEB7|nr:SgcJ/EcaC family oxidoreductase [Myxococcus stipitatus]MCE9670856.1 SgcJ/EcaC family oxidoreductase [Myxococcus stipitatus]
MEQGFDEAGVRAALQRVRAALEMLDVKRFAACFAEDADFNTPPGTWLRGRKAIEEAHEALFAPTPAPGRASFARAKSTVDILGTRFLRPDVAVVDWEWTQTGAMTDGQRWPDRRGLLTIVWTREEDGVWRASAWRNKDYVHLPGAPTASR